MKGLQGWGACQRPFAAQRLVFSAFPFVTDKNGIIIGRIQSPVVPLARVVVWSRYLDKAFVDGEVVSDCVLPALLVLSVVGEIVQNVVVDTAQCELSLGAGTDCRHTL